MVHVYRVGSKKKSFWSKISVNNWIIISNVVLFFVFLFVLYLSSDNLNLIAIKPSNILSGKYLWTFFTSMFMHGGFFHLFANMLSLFFVGSLIEKILGKARYLKFYLASGIFASLLFVLASLVIRSEYDVFAVGASGAIFGLIGLLMVITPNLPVYIMFIPIPIKMKYAAPGMLVVLWLVSIGGNVPIGNTAHLGGFLFGILYGLYLRNKYKNKTRYIQRYFS